MTPLVARRLLQVTTGALAGLAVVAVLTLGLPGFPRSDPGPPVVPVDPAVPEPFEAPSFSLTTHRGEPFSQEDLRGRISVVFFGFASCPDVCPLTLSSMTQALEMLEADGRGFQGVFVSVDPRRDTREALARFMEDFHPGMVALTGPQEEVGQLAGEWGVEVLFHPEEPVSHEGMMQGEDGSSAGHDHTQDPGDGARVPPPEGPYGVTHATRAYVVDEEGWVVRSLPAHFGAAAIVEALGPLLSP